MNSHSQPRASASLHNREPICDTPGVRQPSSYDNDECSENVVDQPCRSRRPASLLRIDQGNVKAAKPPGSLFNQGREFQVDDQDFRARRSCSSVNDQENTVNWNGRSRPPDSSKCDSKSRLSLSLALRSHCVPVASKGADEEAPQSILLQSQHAEDQTVVEPELMTMALAEITELVTSDSLSALTLRQFHVPHHCR